MIERGPNDRLHTSGCSATDHYRTTRPGLFCQLRSLWVVLPTRLRYLVLVVLLGALAITATVAGALLFGGAVP